MLFNRPLEVGILSAPLIRFSIDGSLKEASIQDGKILYEGSLYSQLLFCCRQFTLYDVTIGIQFHWQRQERQVVKGELKLIVEESVLTAVNLVDIEDYLTSVISSEMSADSPAELLKAHSIISRSWLLHPLVTPTSAHKKNMATEGKIIRIYERDKHKLYDVCADDHCQRYQGITRLTNSRVQQAIDATRGIVLCYEGEICDARFHKCCGGRTEVFETCWNDTAHPYLESVSCEFCKKANSQDSSLNDYDKSTHSYYHWQIRYTREELSDLVKKKSGIDLGLITALEPLKRGASGRIYELQIKGTEGEVVVGKELEIRKWLSTTHLFSSNFEVEQSANGFVLNGKGWGHGVGMCQMGANEMAKQGYSYLNILKHYFPKASILSLDKL